MVGVVVSLRFQLTLFSCLQIVELKHIVCVKSALLQAYVQECESPDSPT